MILEGFKNHGFWVIESETRKMLQGFSDNGKRDPRFYEITEKLDYLVWVLEQSNPAFISGNEMNAISNDLNQVNKQLHNDANKWNQYGQLESIFTQIFARFPYPRIKKIFRSEANDVVEEFVALVHRLEGELHEVEMQAKVEQEKVATKHTYLISFLEDVQNRVGKLDAKADAQVANWEAGFNALVTEKISDFSNAFSGSQAERSKAFDRDRQELIHVTSEYKENTEKNHSESVDQRRKVEKEFEKSLSELSLSAEDIVKKLNEMYSAAGKDVLAADFSGNAVEEDKNFRWYTKLAYIFFLIAAVVLAVLWFSLARDGDFRIVDLFMRIPISIVFLIPGYYFASLASEHRASSIKLRSLGLRIKSFDAYMQGANVAEPEKLKTKMASEFFMEQKEEVVQKQPLFSAGSRKAAERAMDLAEKLVEKVPSGKPN